MTEDDNNNNLPKSVDAKFEKWEEFPVEIKLACIRLMDFKTRTRLRATSRSSKALVDPLNFKIDKLTLEFHVIKFKFLPLTPYSTSDKYKLYRQTYSDESRLESMIPLLAHILKNCEIEHFHMMSSPYFSEIEHQNLDNLIKSGSIRIKNFNSKAFDGFYLPFFLEKCWDTVDRMDFYFYKHHALTIDYISKLPSLLNAKKLEIDNWCSAIEPLPISSMIENWIKNDVKVGKKLVILGLQQSLINDILSNFENRKIDSSDEEQHQKHLRIPTNNPKTHILFHAFMKWTDFILSCIVIPSDSKESQYIELLDFHPLLLPN